jgi:putative transcriptional regulator
MLSRVGKDVVHGLKEAAAHVRGEISLRAYEYDVPGLQDWELGRSQPPSAVRAYLTVIDRFPETVEKALLGAA